MGLPWLLIAQLILPALALTMTLSSYSRQLVSTSSARTCLRHLLKSLRRHTSRLSPMQWSYVLGALLVLCACLLIHFRIQMTIIGYEIGALKDKESSLLEAQGELKMKLAQITTQSALLTRISVPTQAAALDPPATELTHEVSGTTGSTAQVSPEL